MPQPLVTVITPTYNHANFIRETINSVLNQEYTAIEYILVDDHSTDDTFKMLAPLYPGEFKYIRHAENKGEAEAVNTGLRNVTGKYFMVVNADDPLLPNAIPTLVNFMESHSDVLCAYPCWNSIDENGKERQHFDQGEYDFKKMVSHCMCYASVGSIFRSEVIKLVGYRDPQFRLHSDFDYWLRIGLAGKMARVPETLATFRVHDGQQSGVKSDERAQEFIRIMEKFFASTTYRYRDLENQGLYWAYLVAASVTDSKMKATKYLWQAAEYHPQSFIDISFWDVLSKRALAVLRR